MKHIILLLSLMNFLFAEPTWVHGTHEVDGHKSAVGIAQAHFPSHVQTKVALMRAKAQLFPQVILQDQENTKSKSELHENNKVKIKDKYKDKEGNLYLLVIAL
ncbi:MAG: hypothetical protein COA44_15485 [Arcobacter sp.]|nr:MAG: hypothetical protein COA44_15485 [Arcobacter sp.]